MDGRRISTPRAPGPTSAEQTGEVKKAASGDD